MKTKNPKTEHRLRLKRKIRKQVSGTATIPRLSVFRSNKFIYAQLIDDVKAVTLASASDAKVTKGAKMARATDIGTAIAVAGIAKGISKVVFDRNGFKYTGRVRAVADGARKGGLVF